MTDHLHELLDWIYETVEPVGTPLAVLAWLTVFVGAIAMARVLQRYRWRSVVVPAGILGAACLAAHLLDYFVTLKISPSLAMEANPIWRIVVERWGLMPAKLYGLTGKLLLSVLGFQLFAFYLLQRSELFPESFSGFADFWRRFGATAGVRRRIEWRRLASFFAFSFALIGPFFFYVALLNSLAESPLYTRLPPMPLVLAVYLAATTAAYLLLTWRAARRYHR